MHRYFNYIKWLFWKHFPKTRPLHFRVKGRIFFNIHSVIQLNENSKIEIEGDADFTSSQFFLEDTYLHCSGNFITYQTVLNASSSTLHFGERVHFKNAHFHFAESHFHCGSNFRVFNGKWVIKKAQINLNDYFLMAGNEDSGLNMSEGSLICGKNVSLHANIRILNGKMKVGDNSNINKGAMVSCMSSITLGNHVMMSYNCVLFDNNSHPVSSSVRAKEVEAGFPNGTKLDYSTVKCSSVTIEDHCWVGLHSIILKGVYIGKNAVVAAGAVVTKNVPENTLVYGNPGQLKPLGHLAE